MNQEYIKPELEVLVLHGEIITTSGNGNVVEPDEGWWGFGEP